MAEPSGPFKSSDPGCGGYRLRTMLAPQPCGQPPVWAGLVYTPYPRPGVVSLAFTCDEHRPHLTAPRRLTDADRAEIQRRRDKVRRALAGQGSWVPDPPLAVGPEARRLLARAIAWSEAHPDESYDSPPGGRGTGTLPEL